MHAIVSPLDKKHYQVVEDLWAELKRKFSVEGVYVTPYPHFSYQVAAHYDLERLIPLLHSFASHHAQFQISTAGLGIFTGASPVLYIPVVRNPRLTRFHEALWHQVSKAADNIEDYYHPEHWMPHITLGFGDMTSEKLSHIINYLSNRDFHWQITVDNIALIYDTGTEQELKERVELPRDAIF